MKKQLLLSSLAALLLLPAQPAFSLPASQYDKPVPEPKDCGNKQGLEYAKTAEYKELFSKAVTDGRKACQQYLKDHPGATDMAVVADIDETVLDNRDYFQGTKDFEWDEFVKWVDKAKAPNLKKTADFLGWARKKGFAIFFVTGRPEELRASTIKNLVHNGIAYDALYLRPTADKRSAIEVKTEYRKQIEALGFKVIVNIGDQVSDLVGGYAVDCEKLPNKLYFVE